VVEVHHALVEDLGQLSADPFGQGWMIKVRVASEGPALTDAAGYARADA